MRKKSRRREKNKGKLRLVTSKHGRVVIPQLHRWESLSHSNGPRGMLGETNTTSQQVTNTERAKTKFFFFGFSNSNLI